MDTRASYTGRLNTWTPWAWPQYSRRTQLHHTGGPPRAQLVFAGLFIFPDTGREHNGCANRVPGRTYETQVAEHVDSVGNFGKPGLPRCVMEN